MKRVTYLVVADEGHKDIIIGSFGTLPDAQEAVLTYRTNHADPFCWIEQSVREPASA